MHRRAIGRFVALSTLAIGCAEPVAPAAEVGSTPNAIIIIGGRSMAVFNAVLCETGIGNPNCSQGAAGHLQLRLSAGEDGAFVVDWRVHLIDASWPFCASDESDPVIVRAGIYGIQDPENFPEGRPLIDLLADRAVLCQGGIVAGSTVIPDELAARMVHDPENFVAVFIGDPDQIIAGTLRLGGPTTAPGS